MPTFEDLFTEAVEFEENIAITWLKRVPRRNVSHWIGLIAYTCNGMDFCLKKYVSTFVLIEW